MNESWDRRIKLTIDSDLGCVFLVGIAVNRICSYMDLPELEAYQLETCVVEAVNNAVEHAYDGVFGHEVEVVVKLAPDRIRFEVYDAGRPLPSADPPEFNIDPDDLESLPERGMGLFIIHQVMDVVEYRVEEGRNVLVMERLLSRENGD
ncbi:MAG: ATP-binding protein [Desulfatibacillaceae bacterium]